MKIIRLEEPQAVKELFCGWQETIIWSCLQGVMGAVYAGEEEVPASAMAVLGDFCFLAGKPDHELAAFWPEGGNGNFRLMIPQNEEWAAVIEEVYGVEARRFTRFATEKEPDWFFSAEFQMELARKLEEEIGRRLPDYELRSIDEELYEACRKETWSRDLVSQYRDYEDYARRGLGVAAVRDGELLAGASAYSVYDGGLEIEIDTREDCRREGMAFLCGGTLLLLSLGQGLYPSWDAHSESSLALAKKLGYRFSHAYGAYEVRRETH